MLAGPRITLRRLEDADAEAVYATTLAARAHLAPWLYWPQHHRTIEETRTAIRDDRLHWLKRDRFSMGIFAHADGTFLGCIAIEAEELRIPAFDLAYWIRPDLEGQGYVSEAVRLVIACAFERLHARRVAIYCDPRNVRSARVAERLGFVFEGHLRQDALTPDGEVRDTLVFALTPEDYERVRATWA
jgi:RimJ/RimL family protein N-acetyltransferase